MKNPFIKYIMKEKKEDIFHSSVHGRAQNGVAMGVASTQSFSERMKIENNRQFIGKYNDSQTAGQRFEGGTQAKQHILPNRLRSKK